MRFVTSALAAAVLGALLVVPAAHASPSKKDIDAYLRQVHQTTGVPGMTAVVTRGDETVHAAGYGRDSGGGAMDADSPLRVASLSKSFTAMAVMILVEDGKIKLDAPVAAQLPGFDMADTRADKVTVRQLLHQTSGFHDSTVDAVDLSQSTSLEDHVARMKDDTLAADPGTAWEYCNANYNVAARLVEVAAGEDFGEVMQRRVFSPLGMDDTAMRDDDADPGRGYNSVFGVWLPRDEGGFRDNSGAGGVITTASDMSKWLSSQSGRGKQLLSEAALAESHTPSKVHDYAMGWHVDQKSGRLEHSGNIMTFNAMEIVDVESGYGVAVMTNGAGLLDPTYDAAQQLLTLAQGDAPAAPSSDTPAQLILGLLTALALGLGVLGVTRARTWAHKRTKRPVWRVWPRLLPGLSCTAVFACYPNLVSFVSGGRTVTWQQLTYFAAPLTIMLATWAAASVVTVAARLLRFRHAIRAKESVITPGDTPA